MWKTPLFKAFKALSRPFKGLLKLFKAGTKQSKHCRNYKGLTARFVVLLKRNSFTPARDRHDSTLTALPEWLELFSNATSDVNTESFVSLGAINATKALNLCFRAWPNRKSVVQSKPCIRA